MTFIRRFALVSIATVATLPLGVGVAAAVTPSEDLVERGVLRDVTWEQNDRDWLAESDTEMNIFVPGTGDTTFESRTAGYAGERPSYAVNYPEAFGPVISGNTEGIGAKVPIFAPSYNESVEIGTEATMDTFRTLRGENGVDERITWEGFSQGARILGDSAEQAHAEGLLSENDQIILSSDPRGPWGIESRIHGTPMGEVVRPIVATEEARDPADIGEDAQVVSVVMTGDPVSNWQWDDRRPVSSLVVNAAGFAMVHSGTSDQSFENVFEPDAGLADDARVFESEEGNTTYVVVETDHPMALAQAVVYDELQVPYSDSDTERWNQQWNQFYEIQTPTAQNAAVPVTEVTTPEVEEASTYEVAEADIALTP